MQVTTQSDTNQSLPKAPRRTRWDMTPSQFKEHNSRFSQQTPKQNQSKIIAGTPVYFDSTPLNYLGETPLSSKTKETLQFDPIKLKELRLDMQFEERNKEWTSQQLNKLLPIQGYQIIDPPVGFSSNRLVAKPRQTQIYMIPDQSKIDPGFGIISSQMPIVRPQQYAFFGKLLQKVDENLLSLDQQRQRKTMTFLLKIKNGNPQAKKSAFRQLVFNCRQLGAQNIFNQVLPLMMSPTLDPHQRHTLVKLIDKILNKLDQLVRPFTKNILAVIQPLLIDEDYYTRIQAKQIIANLSKAAGMPTLISSLRPNVDHSDQTVRNITSKALAVVASALGISQVLPFLKAVCLTKKSWMARQTGMKVIQQIAILMGCSILPYLKQLVDLCLKGLSDQQKKIKSGAASALAALAQASAPYGIEAFQIVLAPLWQGLNQFKDKSLGPYIKAIGYIIPLMDNDNAADYISLIMPGVVKQFDCPDQEMRSIILKVLNQCLSCQGAKASFFIDHIVHPFFQSFWTPRNAYDRRNYKQLQQTTVNLSIKVGASIVLEKIVLFIKEDGQAFRKQSVQTVQLIAEKCGLQQVSIRLQHLLIDAIIFAFHDQNSEDQAFVNAFGAIISGLGLRASPHFQQICGIIHFKLCNKQLKMRQQAADLAKLIAPTMRLCGQRVKLGKLGSIFFQNLGQQYPQVLGSILGALSSIVQQVGMNNMTPPIKDLLPKLTPILRNKHQKVQENIIDLIGKIAKNGAQHVTPKQWMRVCFDLLELLKAHKKKIRRATIVTFGYIAKAIGPQDVLVTLLNNLKVQQRQLRICTTVAIAIVAESCGPFTVLPALMNQYRVQQLNVQNGVLKSLSFMFEYVGQMAKDYIYAVLPLIQDALIDRDLVHRQTATSTIKHLALGVHGLGCQDALIHLLNYMWPNILEVSPHIQVACMEAIDALRLALGPGIILLYILQGLWHPARRVRKVYWRIFNQTYFNSQQNLICFYPQFPEWTRDSLMTFI